MSISGCRSAGKLSLINAAVYEDVIRCACGEIKFYVILNENLI